MRLLIVDLVRRRRWTTAFFFGLLVLMQGLAVGMGNPAQMFWASMGFAFAIGPMNLWLVPRSIWYLPVAKRDIWRAGWLVSVVGTTALTTIAKLLALLVPQARDSFPLATVALSALYDFAYVGVGSVLVILATRPQPSSGPGRRVSAVMKGMADVLLPSGFTAAMLGNFAVGKSLPTHWTDLTALSAAVLVAALGVTIASYFHSPVPVTGSNRIVRQTKTTVRTRQIELGGLSGLPRLIAHEAAWTLMIGGAIIAGSVLFVVGAARLASAPERLSGVARAMMLRFDGHAAPAPGADYGALIFMIGFGVFVASLLARFPAMLRHLRVLPLGAARLNAVLILWPVAIWLVAWAGWLSLHYVIVGPEIPSYHVEAVPALIGISAIVQALSLRFSGFVRAGVFIVAVLAFGPGILLIDASPSAAIATIGVCLIAGAVILNARSLARKSTYDPPGLVFGVMPTAQNWK